MRNIKVDETIVNEESDSPDEILFFDARDDVYINSDNERCEKTVMDLNANTNNLLTTDNVFISLKEIEDIKRSLYEIFDTKNVINDMPLRVKMQNHGAWIPFTFLTNTYSCFHPYGPNTIKNVIEEMPDFFAIKEQRFRRIERLPDMEDYIYKRGIILVSKLGDLEYDDVKVLMRDLISFNEILGGAHFRMFNKNERVYPRDVLMLMKRLEMLKTSCFIWFEIAADKEINSTFEFLCNPDLKLIEKFEIMILTIFLTETANKTRNAHKKSIYEMVELNMGKKSNSSSRLNYNRFHVRSNNSPNNEMIWGSQFRCKSRMSSNLSGSNLSPNCRSPGNRGVANLQSSIVNSSSAIGSPRRSQPSESNSETQLSRTASLLDIDSSNQLRAKYIMRSTESLNISGDYMVTVIRQPRGPARDDFTQFCF